MAFISASNEIKTNTKSNEIHERQAKKPCLLNNTIPYTNSDESGATDFFHNEIFDRNVIPIIIQYAALD